jgi:hypothetical protein
MTGNQAVRAQMAVVMRPPAKESGVSDALVTAIVRRVLDTLGSERADDEEGSPDLVRQLETRLETNSDLIARQTAPMAERVEALERVAAAASAYRRAVRRGKSEKSTRKQLFNAVAAWKDGR